MIVFDILLTNGVLTVFLIVILVTLLWLNIRRPSDLPPGPTIYVPGLGNMLELNPQNLLQKLRDYRKQYGDVFSLKMGSKWWIILNGYDVIHAALVKNADVFSSRPDTFIVKELANYRGIAFSSGNIWKEHRTFALTKLRSFGFGKRSIETNISEEVEVLLQFFDDQKGNAFDIYDIVKRNSKMLENFVEEVIKEHKETFEENNIRDYIDAFLVERSRRLGDDENTFTGRSSNFPRITNLN
ncbi:hypothetical protein KUTeg_024995 [Tegillarca granosa]|uniref:Cytochrome P450 n=1 Tax=Tegillarca granosa TaxID=220873 RepID=A0ABQ9DZG9_TEGGR|nr:hypothetical protein KUTeg_024995 [Tegillarca granosa]